MRDIATRVAWLAQRGTLTIEVLRSSPIAWLVKLRWTVDGPTFEELNFDLNAALRSLVDRVKEFEADIAPSNETEEMFFLYVVNRRGEAIPEDLAEKYVYDKLYELDMDQDYEYVNLTHNIWIPEWMGLPKQDGDVVLCIARLKEDHGLV